MQICESQLCSHVLTRCVLVLASMATIAPGWVGSSEAGQSCGDLVEPQDVALISSAAQIPEAYLARVNAGNAEHLSNLFATDAVWRGPGGQVLNGRAAIREVYEGILSARPKMAVGRSVADNNRVAFEQIRLDQPCNEDDPAIVVEIMDINDDGQITAFTVFMRPRLQ